MPRTCENFLALCDLGYYNETAFHRSIRNFMIQVCVCGGGGQGGGRGRRRQCEMVYCAWRGVGASLLTPSLPPHSLPSLPPTQGGDPQGTGVGGESIYGKNFKDELDSRMLHSGRGVLAMANSGEKMGGVVGGHSLFIPHSSHFFLRPQHQWLPVLHQSSHLTFHTSSAGPNTNGSQFYITYKSCAHLNYKHSVFGRVVGGSGRI